MYADIVLLGLSYRPCNAYHTHNISLWLSQAALPSCALSQWRAGDYFTLRYFVEQYKFDNGIHCYNNTHTHTQITRTRRHDNMHRGTQFCTCGVCPKHDHRYPCPISRSIQNIIPRCTTIPAVTSRLIVVLVDLVPVVR